MDAASPFYAISQFRVSFAAIIVASCALVLAVSQARRQRKHDELSVQPKLVFDSAAPLVFSDRNAFVAIVDHGSIVALDTPATLIERLLATGFQNQRDPKPANLEDVFLSLTSHYLRED